MCNTMKDVGLRLGCHAEEQIRLRDVDRARLPDYSSKVIRDSSIISVSAR